MQTNRRWHTSNYLDLIEPHDEAPWSKHSSSWPVHRKTLTAYGKMPGQHEVSAEIVLNQCLKSSQHKNGNATITNWRNHCKGSVGAAQWLIYYELKDKSAPSLATNLQRPRACPPLWVCETQPAQGTLSTFSSFTIMMVFSHISLTRWLKS